MKKFICITVIASAMLATPHTHTMNPAANKTAGHHAKLIAKKLTSGTFSTLHWTIAGGMSFASGIGSATTFYDESIILKQLECVDADEQTTNFIKSKMHNISSQKIEGVKIAPAWDAIGAQMGVFNKNIIMSQATANEINEAIKTNNQIIQNKWNGTLEHEESHRRHNDLFWRAITGMTMPFVTHGSVKVIRNLLPIAKKARSFGSEQLIKIPTAFGKEMITTCATGAINKTQEQRADNEVTNDIDLLNGVKSTLNDNEKLILKTLSPLKLSQKNLDTFRWVYNFREHHPLNTTRMQKIDQRIALLEKQSHDNNNS